MTQLRTEMGEPFSKNGQPSPALPEETLEPVPPSPPWPFVIATALTTLALADGRWDILPMLDPANLLTVAIAYLAVTRVRRKRRNE